MLELGSGKGAVAVSVARALGFRVRGIDLFEPFVREARERATQAKVDRLCEFKVADFREVLERVEGYDVVIYAGVGGALGRFDRCVGKLRRAVRTGGYLIIDDGYLTGDTRVTLPGFGHYCSHRETLRQLTAHGDSLVQEVLIPASEVSTYNRQNTECIRRRADELMQQVPDLASLFAEFDIGRAREPRPRNVDRIGGVASQAGRRTKRTFHKRRLPSSVSGVREGNLQRVLGQARGR